MTTNNNNNNNTDTKSELISFMLREGNGEIIIPWKDVKDLQSFEWIRDFPESVSPKSRDVLLASYIDIHKVPIVRMGVQTKIRYQGKEVDEYEVAVFQSDVDGRVYDIAKRIADKRKVKVGDKVKLHMLGCCNIMDIKKVPKSKDVK